MSINNYNLSQNRKSRSLSPSFDWSHVNLSDMTQYDRALKIAKIKAEKSLGYQKLDNASRKQTYMLDSKVNLAYPTFEEFKYMG